MKTSRTLWAFLLALASAGALHAFDPKKPLPKTEVVFFEPEKFTDVRDSSFGDSEKARNEILGELRTYVVRQANQLLASGQQLKVTVTDVDLAGDFEPWRGAQWADVRIVKDIYPPRIKLAFKLTDSDGNVLAEGDRDLRDMAFMMRLSINRDDPLKYEKALLDDWVRTDFGGLKKK
jgi:hypothetical protein